MASPITYYVFIRSICFNIFNPCTTKCRVTITTCKITLITKYDAQEEEKFKGLVAIYEKMKPKESARIFDELDIGILLDVFERMKASKSASILAKMKPERAKEITSRIAERREMPSLN